MISSFADPNGTELVIVSADDQKTLIETVDKIIEFIDRAPGVPLVDVAYTCSLTKGSVRLSIIASNLQDLRNRLFSARSRIITTSTRRIKDKSGTYFFKENLLGEGKGRLAFVYSAANGFYPDMMRDLAILYPECRAAFDDLEEALSQDALGFSPSGFIFPPAPYYRHDADIFSSGAYAQALVSTYAGCYALTRLMDLCGLTPHGVVGFAGGDLAAMTRSGAAGNPVTRRDRVKILREVYRVVDKALDHAGLPEVTMVSVLLRHEGEADEIIKRYSSDKILETVDFSPRQKTFALLKPHEEEVLNEFAQAGIRTMKLDLNRPFNTPLCAKFVPYIHKFVKGWMKEKPVCDIYSCATAEKMPTSLRAARNLTAEGWSRPIRFRETIRKMYSDGYRAFVEVGPRGLMTSAVEDTLKGEEFAAISLNTINRRGMLQFQHALGYLAALGADVDISLLLERRGAKKLDFGDLESVVSMEAKHDVEMKLSRAFPRLTLLGGAADLGEFVSFPEAKGRGAKVAMRAAVAAAKKRRQQQFDWGVINPLISDADIISSSPGVAVEMSKVFTLKDAPFLGDFALGTSQLSYADPNLKGLILLPVPVGIEIMAEAASHLAPSRAVVAVEDFVCRRMVNFNKGELKLSISAERISSSDRSLAAVKVQLRTDTENAAFTWPVMEATVLLSENAPKCGAPSDVEPLSMPSTVHWSDREIYPARLCCGKRLRGIRFVEQWSHSGLDYEVEVPPLAGNVAFTRFPLWVVNPLLLTIVTSGFPLWRSHEKFTGAFSFPFRLRRLDILAPMPAESSRLNAYLRLTGVTPKSHISDITLTDGNGTQLLQFSGWEELTERVPDNYREIIMQPATGFMTKQISREALGEPATDVASAFVVDIPYGIFERDEELWLKTLSHVILSAQERREFSKMTGATARRVEWLFGRVAAKEAVRRFMKDFYQARWSAADVIIWADDHGKPHALGEWADTITGKLDIAIAHTSQFVVALAAANAHAGVDVESISRDLSEDFANGVFTPEELELAANAINPSQAVIRFWCAKEAVSKALGTGIRYSPKEMVIKGFLPDSGTLTVQLEGAWLEAFKKFKGRDITVSSRVMRDHALAFSFIPAILFDDE
jgi:phosphopantetheine--protein transferase-like protein